MNQAGRCALLVGTSLGMALVLSGCVANRAYREKVPVLHECAANTVKSADHPCPPQQSYTLAFVEFDDVGEMFTKRSEITADHDGKLDKTELGQTIIEIEQINSEEDAEPVFVVFIHGWHNNASDSSGNVWGFRSALQSLASELNKSDKIHRPVMGIYIGWRGEATVVPVAKNLSFWNRKDAATRIPGAHLTEAVRKITMAAKSNTKATCVVVGHSFGGWVLERTLTQAMVEMILEYKGDIERIDRELAKGSIDSETANRKKQIVENRLQAQRPDLTVLLNEAGPAIAGKQFMNFLHDENMEFVDANDEKVRYPLFLSMTSSGDAATHILFPVGQFLGKHGLSTRTYDEKDEFGETDQNQYYLHTTANSARLVNHSVTRAASTRSNCKEDNYYKKFQMDNTTYYICYDDSPKDSIRNTNPYWAMQIPTEFVPDHSTVFRPELRALLREFIVPLTSTPTEALAREVAPPKALTLRYRQPVNSPAGLEKR